MAQATVGDVVQLRSGGPVMTAIEWDRDDGRLLRCAAMIMTTTGDAGVLEVSADPRALYVVDPLTKPPEEAA